MLTWSQALNLIISFNPHNNARKHLYCNSILPMRKLAPNHITTKWRNWQLEPRQFNSRAQALKFYAFLEKLGEYREWGMRKVMKVAFTEVERLVGSRGIWSYLSEVQADWEGCQTWFEEYRDYRFWNRAVALLKWCFRKINCSVCLYCAHRLVS